MCEIFLAFKLINGTIGRDVLEEILQEAAISADSNRDGFGCFDENRNVFKSHNKFEKKYIQQIIKEYENSSLFVMHLRSATTGTVCHANTHPFRIGKNLMVHNGIARFEKSCIKEEDSKKDITDSQKILELIVEDKAKTMVESIQNAMKKISGSVSCVLFDEGNNLYYFRETSRFLFALMVDKALILGATDGNALKRMFITKKFGFYVRSEKMTFFQPKEREIYGLTKNDGLVYYGNFTMLTGYGESLSSEEEKWDYKRYYKEWASRETIETEDDDLASQLRNTGVPENEIRQMVKRLPYGYAGSIIHDSGKHTIHLDKNRKENTPTELAMKITSDIDEENKKSLSRLIPRDKKPGCTVSGSHAHTQGGLCIPSSSFDENGMVILHYEDKIAQFNFFKRFNSLPEDIKTHLYSELLEDRSLNTDGDNAFCGRHGYKMEFLEFHGLKDLWCRKCIAEFLHFYIQNLIKKDDEEEQKQHELPSETKSIDDKDVVGD